MMKKAVILLLCLATLIVSACQASPASNPVDKGNPTSVAGEVFRQMREGAFDGTFVELDENTKQLLQEPNENPYFRFDITEISISSYNEETKTLEYECVLPHPMMAAVQMYKSKGGTFLDTKYKPAGVEMKGTFRFAGDKQNGYKIIVDEAKSPISIYINLVDFSDFKDVQNYDFGDFADQMGQSKDLLLEMSTAATYYTRALNIDFPADAMVDEIIKMAESMM